MQYIVIQLPDAFINTKRVTKSPIPATNVSTKVGASIENKRLVELKTHQKHGQQSKLKIRIHEREK